MLICTDHNIHTNIHYVAYFHILVCVQYRAVYAGHTIGAEHCKRRDFMFCPNRNHPGVFARVTNLMGWIQETMRGKALLSLSMI